jgi:hypothetical protein
MNYYWHQVFLRAEDYLYTIFNQYFWFDYTRYIKFLDYLIKAWFLNDPNDDNLLFLAYIDYKVYIVPNDNGNV